MVLAIALCFLVGVSLGLLGAGGSILIVPILVYAAGMGAKEAFSLSLGIASVTSFAGAIWYFSRGFVNKRLAFIFTGFGSAGAFAGAGLTPLFAHETLLFIFGIIMLGVGLLMMVKKDGELDEGALQCRPRFISAMFTSLSIGVLTGFLGVGGGFLIVPALSLMMKCSMKTAIGTSLIIISATAMAGFAGHALAGGIHWEKAAAFSITAALGAFAGNALSHKTQAGFLKKLFGVLIISTGVFVIIQNIRMHS